mgnify:CR=1 FL=1
MVRSTRHMRTVGVLGERSVQLVLDAGGVAARRLRGLQLSDHLHQARRAVQVRLELAAVALEQLLERGAALGLGMCIACA